MQGAQNAEPFRQLIFRLYFYDSHHHGISDPGRRGLKTEAGGGGSALPDLITRSSVLLGTKQEQKSDSLLPGAGGGPASRPRAGLVLSGVSASRRACWSRGPQLVPSLGLGAQGSRLCMCVAGGRGGQPGARCGAGAGVAAGGRGHARPCPPGESRLICMQGHRKPGLGGRSGGVPAGAPWGPGCPGGCKERAA